MLARSRVAQLLGQLARAEVEALVVVVDPASLWTPTPRHSHSGQRRQSFQPPRLGVCSQQVGWTRWERALGADVQPLGGLPRGVRDVCHA